LRRRGSGYRHGGVRLAVAHVHGERWRARAELLGPVRLRAPRARRELHIPHRRGGHFGKEVAARAFPRPRRLVGPRLFAAGALGHRERRRRVSDRVLGGQHRRRRAPRHMGGERLPPRCRLDESVQARTRIERAEAVHRQHSRRHVGARVHAAEVHVHRRSDVHRPAGIDGAEQSSPGLPTTASASPARVVTAAAAAATSPAGASAQAEVASIGAPVTGAMVVGAEDIGVGEPPFPPAAPATFPIIFGKGVADSVEGVSAVGRRFFGWHCGASRRDQRWDQRQRGRRRRRRVDRGRRGGGGKVHACAPPRPRHPSRPPSRSARPRPTPPSCAAAAPPPAAGCA